MAGTTLRRSGSFLPPTVMISPSGETTTSIFIADGADDAGVLVMRSKNSRNLLGNTTLTYKYLRMFSSHSMSLWKQVTRVPDGSATPFGQEGTKPQKMVVDKHNKQP